MGAKGTYKHYFAHTLSSVHVARRDGDTFTFAAAAEDSADDLAAVESGDGNGDRQCSRSERASERGPLKSCRERMGWAEVANFCARGEIGRTDLCDAANNGALHSNFCSCALALFCP